jgi:hypothetical protein
LRVNPNRRRHGRRLAAAITECECRIDLASYDIETCRAETR